MGSHMWTWIGFTGALITGSYVVSNPKANWLISQLPAVISRLTLSLLITYSNEHCQQSRHTSFTRACMSLTRSTRSVRKGGEDYEDELPRNIGRGLHHRCSRGHCELWEQASWTCGRSLGQIFTWLVLLVEPIPSRATWPFGYHSLTYYAMIILQHAWL